LSSSKSFSKGSPSSLARLYVDLTPFQCARSSFIRSLLTEAADEGLFALEHSLDRFHVDDGISEGFVNIQPTTATARARPLSPSPSSVFSALSSTSSASSSSITSGILSPQPQLKQQQILSHSQSPLAERDATANSTAEADAEYDLARSEAERGQLKDIVLKFHRDRHALLSPQEDVYDFGALPPSVLSATTPNRNGAPSPYPYQHQHQHQHSYATREDLAGVGLMAGGQHGVAAGVDPTMSPPPRGGQVPKVCLSPYKRTNLVYSGQHIHSSLSTSSSLSSLPTRKVLFNSGDALSTTPTSSSSSSSSSPSSMSSSRDRLHGIDLGLLPSSSSPPLPMQREIVDKVKVALDEAMQSVKTRIIDVSVLAM
jgi:hypothetical protein